MGRVTKNIHFVFTLTLTLPLALTRLLSIFLFRFRFLSLFPLLLYLSLSLSLSSYVVPLAAYVFLVGEPNSKKETKTDSPINQTRFC